MRETVRQENSLIRAHAYAAVITLLISAIFGTIVSLKLQIPDFANSHPWLTWGRLRYNHTQGIFFGWLGNAFLMFLYYAVPKLANKPVLNKHLGWCLFILWNLAVVLPGWFMVMAGMSQPLEWAEFPLIIDGMVELALVLSVAQFAVPLIRTKLSKLYVSGWYIIGALIFTILAYPVGNIVPELVAGAQGAAFSGLWIHDAIGLYVTPLALSMAFLVIPLATGRPIYSHFLSMIGFWLLFFVYPLNGTHHYVFSAIPMDAQKGAIVASVYLGMDVILVVTNLLMSMRGASQTLKDNLPLRFVWAGTIMYLVVSLQGSAQALMPVNKLVHFSDWVIGHSHLAMTGFATFTAIGGMTHVWQSLPGVRYNKRALSWCYWLLLTGLIAMVAVLSVAGLVEAHMWQSALPWIDSVRTAHPYWSARTHIAGVLLAGFACFIHAITSGPRNPEHAAALVKVEEGGESKESSEKTEPTEKSRPTGWLSMAYLSSSVAGVGFFLLSFSTLAVAPGITLQKEIDRTKPANMAKLTAQESDGRSVYAREGCAYCHTQQVRVVASDVERFGAPTRAWETAVDYPHLWGTRRIGPDLSRESGVRSDDWQLTHLYNPRLVVSDSVMPGYPWLFDGSAAQPTKEALALLAYLKSLGRERQLAGVDHISYPIPPYCSCPDDIKRLESQPTASQASPAFRRQADGGVSVQLPTDSTQIATAVRRGTALFAQNCASCHGASADGNGEAAPTLLPHPADLTSKRLTTGRIATVLMNGVPGSAMPAWRDLPQRDVEALVAYLVTLPKPDTEKDRSTLSIVDATKGKSLFSQKCASCHGLDGDGKGAAAAALQRRPANFLVEQPGIAYSLKVMKEGVAGTAMPPWAAQLSHAERLVLAAYIRSLYKGEK